MNINGRKIDTVKERERMSIARWSKNYSGKQTNKQTKKNKRTHNNKRSRNCSNSTKCFSASSILNSTVAWIFRSVCIYKKKLRYVDAVKRRWKKIELAPTHLQNMFSVLLFIFCFTISFMPLFWNLLFKINLHIFFLLMNDITVTLLYERYYC